MPSSGVTPGGTGGGPELAALQIALDDLTAQVAQNTSDIDAAENASGSLAGRITDDETAFSVLQSHVQGLFASDVGAGINPAVGSIAVIMPGGRTVAVPAAIVTNPTLWDQYLSLPSYSYGTLTITSSATRAIATQGQSGYTDQLSATGSLPVGFNTWLLTSGALPSGLRLNSDGSITGNVAGGAPVATYSFTAQITDPWGITASKNFTMDVIAVAAHMSFTPDDPLKTDAVAGTAYAFSIKKFVANAQGVLTFALTSPPSGWTIDATGATAGAIRCANPTPGGSVVTLTGTVNDTSTTLSWSTHVIVDSAIVGPKITTTSLPDATNGQWYAAFLLTDGGGTAPYTWTPPTMPAGLHCTPSSVLLNAGTGTSGSTSIGIPGHALSQGQPVFIGTNTIGLVVNAVYWVLSVPDADHVTLGTSMAANAFSATATGSVAAAKIGGSIWGKPTVTDDPGTQLTYKVTDSTPAGSGGPLSASKLLTIRIAAPGGSFTFPATFAISPDPVAGTDYGGFDCLGKATGYTGTLTWMDWDPAQDLTATATASSDTLHATGLGTKYPVGSSFALSGMTGSGQGGLLNGPFQHYATQAVVDADTIKVGLAATPTVLVNITADLTGIVVHDTTLPLHKMRFDYDGSITGHAGRIYTTPGDAPAAAQAAFTCTVSVTDSGTATTKTATVSITIDAGGNFTDISGLAGLTFGLDPSDTSSGNRTKAKANLAALDAAAAALFAGDGYLKCGDGATAYKLVISYNSGYLGEQGGNGSKLRRWWLKNVDLEVMYDEPIGTANATSDHARYAMNLNPTSTGCDVQFKSINCHGKNQKQYDESRTDGSIAGCEIGCIRVATSTGPVSLGNATVPLSLLNPRSLVGANGTIHVSGTSKGSTGTAVWCSEVMHGMIWRCSGGGGGWVHVAHTDGAGATERASGLAHDHALMAADGTSPWWKGVLTADTCRHACSCFAGGRVQWLPGSSATNCDHGFQCEAGTINTSLAQHATIHYCVGANVAAGETANYGDITTTNCGIGVQYNGNGNSDDHLGIGQMQINGWTSTGDGTAGQDGAFNATGGAPWSDSTLGCDGTVTLRKVRITDPDATSSKWGAASNIASAIAPFVTLVDAALHVSAGGHAVATRGSAPAHGAWGTF